MNINAKKFITIIKLLIISRTLYLVLVLSIKIIGNNDRLSKIKTENNTAKISIKNRAYNV